MNDKTLLELAAKAAGINVVGDIEKYLVFPERRAGGFIIESTTGGHTGWNPLTDDGDALRLAVMLEIELKFNDAGVAARAKYFDVWQGSMRTDDKNRAVRYVITKAAAEVGKAA